MIIQSSSTRTLGANHTIFTFKPLYKISLHLNQQMFNIIIHDHVKIIKGVVSTPPSDFLLIASLRQASNPRLAETERCV